jgi:putative nucleotidyltransferase with HDIG domain
MQILALDDIVKGVRQLPSLPVVVVDILSSFDDAQVDVGLLAEKIAHDQALTAKTLQLANSSFYGLARRVTTLQQAITILGFSSLRTLLASVAIFARFPETTECGLELNQFWRHSMATALAAKALARHVHLNQDLAFIAGLLHDIGSLVLATRFPEHYRHVIQFQRESDCYLLEAERAVLGSDHTAAGLSLADYWCFPSAMRDAIALHHAPRVDKVVDMPALIHVAEAIAHALDLNEVDDELVPVLSDDVWRSLNLGEGAFDMICKYVEAEFEKACQVLRT